MKEIEEDKREEAKEFMQTLLEDQFYQVTKIELEEVDYEAEKYRQT